MYTTVLFIVNEFISNSDFNAILLYNYWNSSKILATLISIYFSIYIIN